MHTTTQYFQEWDERQTRQKIEDAIKDDLTYSGAYVESDEYVTLEGDLDEAKAEIRSLEDRVEELEKELEEKSKHMQAAENAAFRHWSHIEDWETELQEMFSDLDRDDEYNLERFMIDANTFMRDLSYYLVTSYCYADGDDYHDL